MDPSGDTLLSIGTHDPSTKKDQIPVFEFTPRLIFQFPPDIMGVEEVQLLHLRGNRSTAAAADPPRFLCEPGNSIWCYLPGHRLVTAVLRSSINSLRTAVLGRSTNNRTSKACKSRFHRSLRCRFLLGGSGLPCRCLLGGSGPTEPGMASPPLFLGESADPATTPIRLSLAG